jgi:hypothetical protein
MNNLLEEFKEASALLLPPNLLIIIFSRHCSMHIGYVDADDDDDDDVE